jgi:protein gp37
MADHTHIEWTEATWNPITGCTVHSPGCTNCYAMKLAGTRLAHHPSRAGLTVDTKAGPVWNGQVRFNEEWLTQPLKWKRPRMIFVCAHGDLFHESVPDEWIDRVFAVMALCPQHTFQVLTKRSARMREYLTGIDNGGERMEGEGWRSALVEGTAQSIWHQRTGDDTVAEWLAVHLPLPNVWLGVSVEDQARADERVPDLLHTPAAVRWISAEPLLGEVKLFGGSDDRKRIWNWLTGETGTMHFDGPDFDYGPKLDWIVVGGESGPGARPMHPDWARSLRDQCAAAGVPFFFKQWGEWAPIGRLHDDDGDTDETIAAENAFLSAKGKQFDDGDWWTDPSDCRIVDLDMFNWANECAQHPADCIVIKRLGKKRAGRLLDGQGPEHTT